MGLGLPEAIIGSAVLGIGGSMVGANQQKKAIEGAMGAQKQVDIGKLIADSRVNAEENLKRSLQLEQQYTPELAAARQAASANLLQQLTGAPAIARQQALMQASDLAANRGVSSLTQSAADRILADLNLGASLDTETQSAVMRGALSGAGGAGILGSQAGRGLLARDLGLTSIQLQQARQQQALAAGGQLDAAYLQSLGLLGNLTGSQLGLASQIPNALGPTPEAGLSASDIANVSVGQTNAYNQNLMNAAGLRSANTTSTIGNITSALSQGLGLAAGFGALSKTTTTTPTTTTRVVTVPQFGGNITVPQVTAMPKFG